MKIHSFIIIAVAVFFLSSCVIVRPGEVGVKQKLGKLSNEVHEQGAVWFSPFTTVVIKTNIQITDLKLVQNLPSKEGLSVKADISILYRIAPSYVPKVIRELGKEYEVIIANVFKSASSDVCAHYLAKDMHSGKRYEIEKAIKVRMAEVLSKQGIVVEEVLMKSIQLPARLSKSIEEKLQAEQDAMRMEFILQIARKEAERKIIEATGQSKAQIILSEGLTDQIIRMKSIEAFNELAKSPNGKVIITDGKTPFLIEVD